jgi:hypothetical protein
MRIDRQQSPRVSGLATAAMVAIAGAIAIGAAACTAAMSVDHPDAATATGGAVGAGTGGGAGGGMAGTGAAGGNLGSGGARGAGGAGAGGVTGSGGATGGAGFGIAGPSRCATAGVALCESFENGLDGALWTITRSGDASIAVDSLRAARGSKALHVKTSAGNGFAFITENRSFPATNNILYGRMFVWFEDDITTTGHFSLAEGGGTGTPGVARFGGQFKELGVGTDGGASGDWTDHDDQLIPSQTWICAEFEFKGDTHEFRVWWNDVERAGLRSGPSRHPNYTMPQFNRLWFGWWMYNMVEPQELWIDEIAVDFKPIGCAR